MLLENLKNNELIIDFHVHVFPDHVAPRAMETLFTAYGCQPFSDGTLAGLEKQMRKCGVDYAVVQPVATKPDQVESINNWAASHSNPRIISFGGIHPGYSNIEGENERILSLGLPGIKIQGNWQGVQIDDKSMYPIYEAAQGRLIVLFHMGEERAQFPQMLATPAHLAKIIKDFPKLTIVAAHMGGYLMWDQAEEYLIGKNIYLDTSACFPEDLSDERFLKMIRNHGVEKVLFATDSPLVNPCDDIQRICELGLTDSELRRILGLNAKELLEMHGKELAYQKQTEAAH